MSGRDNGSANILTICIANANPAIMCALIIQIAGDGLAAQIVDHPEFCILPGVRIQFWCIDTVQSHWCAIDHNCICIAHIQTSRVNHGGSERNDCDC